MNAQEWIDRYVNAVGEALPLRERGDVEAEIRSLIQDELEARGAELGNPDEQTVLSVLEQFGRPETLAARYAAPRVLIGPAIFPIFRLVTTIVLLVLTGVWLFGIVINVVVQQQGIENPFEMFAGLVGGLFQVFGTIVFVFALIETFTRGKIEAEAKDQAWNPRTLPKIEQTERVKVGEVVISIVFNVLAILVFNAYPEWVSAIFITNGEVTSMPLLSANFLAFVPWLTVMWSLDIALSAYVLAQGRWRLLTRLLEIGLSIFGLAILGWMLVSGPMLAWPALEMPARLTVAIVFAVTAVELLVQVYRLVTRRIASSGSGAPLQAV
jgi:hypothetical protein